MLRFARPDPIRPRWLVAGVITTLGSLLVAAPSAAAATTASSRVNLRVLVVSNGDPASQAIATELDREGIPSTQVNVTAAGRPTIDGAFLEDASTHTAKYQAVVLPNQAGGGLAAAELTALSTYEAAYGVRQIDGYDFPTTTMGTVFSGVSGTLDGSPAAVTAAGLAGPFAYLKGPFTIEDVDPAVSETFGYLANPDPAIAAGQTFTPLVNATFGGSTGSILGVYAHDGREELVVTASFNSSMQWFDILAPGIVSWATRGIELGYQRNYFTMHVDDIFLGDSRWSITGNCTPGDGCVDPAVTTTDIRMTPADVTKLVAWQNANKLKLTMVFNGFGSDSAKADTGSDPLTDAFLANKAQFPWVNHTYSHAYLGCIQIAATVVGGTWHCATSATETPRMDPEVTQAPGRDGLYYADSSEIRQQVRDNRTWATTNQLPNFDPTVLVTGEHSGLKTGTDPAHPQQPNDNPFLAPALAGLGVRWTASDASRETDTRALSATTSTVPRHPMNIFYNAGTYQDEVDEYNWIYTAPNAANPSVGGACVASSTNTCITPLDASSEAAATASFNAYIKPLEIRNALRYVLTNDPRPFYAHQSNLTEDGILYPVLDGILSIYNSSYDTTKTPLVQATMAEEGQALTQMNAWKGNAGAYADGYIDTAGIHLPTASVKIPVTVPTGTTGATLGAYGASLSGWLDGGSVLVPPVVGGGYKLTTAPAAPTNVSAIAGDASAVVTWTAPPADATHPVLRYEVHATAGTTALPVQTTADASTTLTVTGLANGTPYTFTVVAVNDLGPGLESAPSAPVTPQAAPAPPAPPAAGGGGGSAATVAGAPTLGPVTAGNGQLLLSWTPPAQDGGSPITGYVVKVYKGTGSTVATTLTAPAGATSGTVTGLINGTGYTVDVAAVNAVGTGAASARSAIVTPTAPTAPAQVKTVSVRRGDRSLRVAWKAPAAGGSSITRYVVTLYVGKGTKAAKIMTVAAPALTGTLRGLKNGTGYTVDVRAVNRVGTGRASARSGVVVPATVPGAPVITKVAAGARGGKATASLSWRAPKADGGSKVVAYRVVAVRLSRHGHVAGRVSVTIRSGRARSLVVRLPAGLYRFTVQAVNAVGASGSSTASKPVRAR